MPDRSFWKDRRVFLTGHTGFKGSWLSLWLDALGAKVTGYALEPPTAPSLFDQAKAGAGVRSILGDIRDFARLKSALSECSPSVVIHMAAQSVVRRGYEDPIETYSSNVIGSVHLLEAVRQMDRPCTVVMVTSDKCYENREWDWGYRENDPLGGKDPYSSSKACAELVTSAFRDSYFSGKDSTSPRVAVASARAGNVIGGGDWTRDQLVPDIMRAFLSGQPCRIRNRSAVRPWQFVLEPLRGYLVLAERLTTDPARYASAWNFGPAESDAREVGWIASELARLWGDGASWSNDAGAHAPEAHFLTLDASKTRARMDWKPALSLTQALVWIVEWYRAFQCGEDLQHLTRTQINRYEQLLSS
jgi:CDP-glucose 4,6-dehydratase